MAIKRPLLQSIYRVLALRHLHVMLLHEADEGAVLVLGPVDKLVKEVEDVLRRDFAKLGEDVDVRQALAIDQQRRLAAVHKVGQLLAAYHRWGVGNGGRVSAV